MTEKANLKTFLMSIAIQLSLTLTVIVFGLPNPFMKAHPYGARNQK